MTSLTQRLMSIMKGPYLTPEDQLTDLGRVIDTLRSKIGSIADQVEHDYVTRRRLDDLIKQI